VHAARPDVIFAIVGDGERRRDLEATAANLGLGDRARFLGWRKDLATVYGAADACVLTSRNEGTPVAVIEALAAGLPVVSTDVGGVRDVVNDPVLGAVAPDNDVHGLATHLLTALSPDARTPERVAARRAAVTARYGFDRLVSDLATLYHSLL